MTTTHRTTTTALLILSLAAAGAPAASAMPAGAEPVGPAKPAPAAVYSRQDKSTIPATAHSTAAGTAANDGSPSTPTTSGPRSEVVSGGGYGSGAPTIVRVVDGNSGFDWADAAIGAAGGIVLSMLGLGGAHGVSQYRTRRTRHTAALSG
ncbi:MAG: hypothetical protein ACXVVQ_10625 [Solirubrobacteraceae bacterium]